MSYLHEHDDPQHVFHLRVLGNGPECNLVVRGAWAALSNASSIAERFKVAVAVCCDARNFGQFDETGAFTWRSWDQFYTGDPSVEYLALHAASENARMYGRL